MMYEDARSYQLRDYDWQCASEQREQEAMFNCELEQCEVDNFWGIDLFERRKNDEELRLRRAYEEKVARMNALLVRTTAIQRFDKPALVKVGTLHEDQWFHDDDRRRRDAVIRKLKAEEVRTQMVPRPRPRPGYLSEKWKPMHDTQQSQPQPQETKQSRKPHDKS